MLFSRDFLSVFERDHMAGSVKLSGGNSPVASNPADSPRVGEILQNALTALVKATRAANALPKTSLELDLYRSFPSYLGFCHEQAAGLQSRLAYLVRQVGSLPPPPGADVDDQLENIVEANDGIMERVSLILDSLSGLRRSELPVLPTGLEPPKIFVSSWNRGRKGEAENSTLRLLSVGRLPRPQLSFPTPPNNSNRRFLPKLQSKPNALSPLPSELLEWQKKEEKRKMKDEEEPHPQLFVHPYKYEVEQLEMPAHLLEAPTQKPPDPMEDGGCEIVQDPEKLQAVLDDLMKYKEIAVDLEHHSYRSYLGFTCLIQLSTPDKDYILDALVLRGHLHLLNQAFTHPGILKVFHGASMDVIWLQRDFGVYVVSMWDTAEGSRLLTGRRAGLRHLLLQYCDVSADKRYQLADWRIRPLPDEMVRYARQDTHYLLYIALRQRQDLLDRGGVSFIRQAWSLSKAVTLKHYEKPLYSEEVFEDFLNSRERGFTPNPRNITAMRFLHAWRDNVARVEDESTGYVLPNHMLLKISRELPKTVQGVLACCVPPPPLLCRHLADVHTLVLRAWNSPEASAQQGANGKPEHLEKPANENVVYCTQLCDEQTATSSLLAIEQAVESVPITQPVISLFEESYPQIGKGAKRKQRALEIEQSFSNPFMLFLPSIAAKVLVPCPGGLVDQTTQSFAMLQKWKLLDATPTPEKLPKKRSAETPKVLDSSGKEGRSRSIKEQIHGSSTQNDGEIKKKKKKKKTLKQAPEPIQLHSYDYSQSDFSIFNTPATGKKKDFDPTRETREKAKGTREKSKETREMKRIAPRRQFEPRGVSYVQGKYARDTAHRWPRR